MNSKPLWTADDIIKATKGICHHNDWAASGVAIDSRSITSGDLFIAISGPVHDGHVFVQKALESGAVAAVVSYVPEGLADTDRLVVVPDTLQAMEDLGRAARSRCLAKVIAVTGSVGKTGTKEALAHVLSRQGRTHFSVGSFNNHWGVPLSLSRMPQETEFAIFELGMNHAGELGPLSRMVKPDVAIITTVAAAHLEFFDNTSDIARAKAEIYEGVAEQGLVLLNGDNEFCDLLVSLAEQAGIKNISLFGERGDADICLHNVQLNPHFSMVSASIFEENVTFKLGVPGRHWVQNILAVLGAVQGVGGDVSDACLALKDITAPRGRGALLTLENAVGDFSVIDESYNASPVAMQAAFQVLGKMAPAGNGHKIAVLGDMRELGNSAPKIHANLANDISDSGIDMVYACGPNMRYLFDALPDALKAGYEDRSTDLVQPLLDVINKGDIVLIKGSLGSNMRVVLDALQDASDKQSAARKAGV